MKKLLVTLTAVLVSVSTFAQGTVNFNNRVTGQIDAPVTRPDGSGAGPSVNAQLFQVTGSGATATYTAIGQATTFRAGTVANPLLAAYVNPIASMAINGAAPGSSISVVLRAWEGASYDGALVYGQSNPITVALGGDIPNAPPQVPGNLTGLQGFTLTIVPEPSTIALGLLGATALLYRRRK
jgi:hypothetical protein